MIKLSAYDLACGYLQQAKNECDGTEITLSGDEHHTCYWVHHYRSGIGLAVGYINYKQSYHTLTEARRAFNSLVRSEHCS